MIMLLGLLTGILVPLSSTASASPRTHLRAKSARSVARPNWSAPKGGWAKSINPVPSPLPDTRRGVAIEISPRPHGSPRGVSPLTTCTSPEWPTGLTASNLSSYDPYIQGTVNCNGSSPGVWAFFKVKDSTGSVIYSAESSSAILAGNTAQTQIPTGNVRSGDTYTWYMYDCLTESGTTCSANSAIQTLIPDPLLNAGDNQGATYESFPAGDRLSVRVNVASGDLEIKQSDISLAGILSPVPIGQVYNSLASAPGSSNASGLGLSPGWGLTVGGSVELQRVSGGAVALYDSSGRVWLFTGDAGEGCGTTYVSPAGIDATLTVTCNSATPPLQTGFTLKFNQSNDTQYYLLPSAGATSSPAVLSSDTDRDNNTVTYAYPSSPTQLGSITGTRGSSNVVSFNYTSGSLTSITQGGPGPRSATLGYTSGNLTSVLDPAGNTTQFSYTSGLLTKVTEGNGDIITFTYDSRDRVQSVTQDPSGIDAVTGFTYTNTVNGNTVMKDALLNSWTYTPDYADRVKTEKDPSGNTVYGSTYNGDAKPLTLTNGIGTASYTYDNTSPSNGENMKTATDGSAAETIFSYVGSPSNFLPSSSQDPAGNTTNYTYDGSLNPNSSQNFGLGTTAKVTYNMNGTAEYSTDPAGNVTNYGYGSTQNLTTITPPTVVSPPSDPLDPTNLTYDQFGRIHTIIDGNGVTQTITYDGLDRVTEVQYSDSTPTVTYTYDGDGYLKTRVAGGVTVNYGYDTLNRETSDDITGGASLSYGYDAIGDMTSLTDSRGTTTYNYNSDEELGYMTEGSTGNTDVFDYYSSSRQREDIWDDTGGVTTVPPTSFAMHSKMVYNGANHMTSLVVSRASSDSTVFENLSYCYSFGATSTCGGGTPTDNLYVVTNNLTAPVTTTTYSYDQGNRMTSAVQDNSGPTYSYAYTTNSNISSFNGTSYDYGANPWNEVDNTGWAYDYDGNLTANPTLGTLTYNGASQTTKVGSVSISYATQSQQEVTAIGGTTLVNGLLGVQSTAAAGATRYFERTPDGQLISEDTPTGEHYYATDYQGSVLAIVGTAGYLDGTYTYDPYGNVTNTLTSAAMANSLRFAGGYFASTISLYHFGARWYDPTVGRWTQPDSIVTLNDPMNGNLYAYVKDNPVNETDPSGRDASNGQPGCDYDPDTNQLYNCYVPSSGTSSILGPINAGCGLVAGAALTPLVAVESPAVVACSFISFGEAIDWISNQF